MAYDASKSNGVGIWERCGIHGASSVPGHMAHHSRKPFSSYSPHKVTIHSIPTKKWRKELWGSTSATNQLR
ncbi:hypothetical protein CMV_024946 [Castanea mollissima]|uniref:Uncharacterized protein n=1 Tax=Castanea mollissima TaxID=60419 RepID=A0A8J4QH26_9ROSI|nr:hypothetical protein CMV_024946 [Castanea mollissima]